MNYLECRDSRGGRTARALTSRPKTSFSGRFYVDIGRPYSRFGVAWVTST
jgi:hypothetical protein